MSRQYSRVFISIKQDRAGYGFKGKEPSGRCVIEAKSGVSKLTMYIQDIKPEIIYKAYIISSSHNISEGVLIGTLNADSKGKAELRWEFDADNVCGTGRSIEEFNVFAVLIPSNSDLLAPLAGYREAVVSWKNNFVVYSSESKKGSEVNTADNNKPQKAAPEDKQAEPELEVPILTEYQPQKDIEALDTSIADIETSDIDISEKEDSGNEASGIEASLTVSALPAIDEAAPVIIADEDSKICEDESNKNKDCGEESCIETTDYNPEAKKYSTADDFFGSDSVKKGDINLNEEIIKGTEEENETVTVLEQTQPQSEPIPEEAPDIHAAFLEMAKNFSRELKELEQITFINPEESSGISAAEINESEGASQHGKTEAEPSASEEPVSDGIGEIFKNNPAMNPFQKQNIDVSWVRISMREIVFLPLDHWKYMNHPLLVSAYNRFRHLMLGKYDENGEYRYFLGIPEIYDSDYKKSAMSLGFTQFKCCEDIRAINGEYGYWIMPLQY